MNLPKAQHHKHSLKRKLGPLAPRPCFLPSYSVKPFPKPPFPLSPPLRRRGEVKMNKLPSSQRGARFPVQTLTKPPPQSTSSRKDRQREPISDHYTKKTTEKISRTTATTSLTATTNLPKPPSTLSEAKSLLNSLSTKAPPDTNLCNSVLQSFSSVSTLQDSISLLNHMIRALPSFSPNCFTFHIIVCQSLKSEPFSHSSLAQTLDLMSSHGFPPNTATTDIAIRTLCSVDLVDEAVEVIKLLSLKHAPPDSYTYNFLVKHLVKNRSLSYVHSFIDEMRSGFGFKPDLVTYTIMIDNVCNKKNLREAMRLLEVLSEEGFKPDTYVYNTIMKGHCMLSQGGEVLRVYKKMEEDGVKPDLVSFNTLVFGLSKCGRVKDAMKYLKVMADMGHFPDAITYTSLMNGMCREGNALRALALLEEMEGKGCIPNSCTYNTLLNGLCKSRYLDKGVELYEVMKAGEIKLESGSYATFLRALCRNGRVAEAYEVFDYAVESKSLTDVSAYSTLEVSLKWLKKAKEQGLAV